MERFTAQEAMAHPYFREVRESELKMKGTNAMSTSSGQGGI